MRRRSLLLPLSLLLLLLLLNEQPFQPAQSLPHILRYFDITIQPRFDLFRLFQRILIPIPPPANDSIQLGVNEGRTGRRLTLRRGIYIVLGFGGKRSLRMGVICRTAHVVRYSLAEL